MKDFMTKISENGKVFIPAEYRRELALKSGDEVVVRMINGVVQISTVRQMVTDIQNRVRRRTKIKDSLVELKKMRAEDGDE